VNGLAAINEQSGTEAGDAVVKAVADALRDAFRLADVVGRVGDDEFGALLVDYAADPKVALAHIDTAIKERSAVGDLAAEVSVSIGAAFFDPKWPASLDELIGQAAVARTD
jgi:diguanylate cyclase (GGDEF)-like protein